MNLDFGHWYLYPNCTKFTYLCIQLYIIFPISVFLLSFFLKFTRWEELEELVELELDGEGGEDAVVDQSRSQICQSAGGVKSRILKKLARY